LFGLANLTDQNIIVTGGAGFAGRYVIKRLLADGHCIYALVRNKQKLRQTLGKNFCEQQPSLKVIEVEKPERATIADITQIIEDNNITSVVHIAAIVGEQRASWKEYYESNVIWTKNLALAFLAAKVQHQKFIFTSSVGVYGTIPKQVPANEETKYNPDGKYHKSKVLAEKELLELQSSANLPLIILRPTILYGEEDHGFLLKFSKLMEKKIFPLSKSNPCIHLLDVATLAEACSLFVKSSGNGIFNVCDREPVKIKDISICISNATDGGYVSVPSLVFKLLRKLLVLSCQYSVSVKLISQSWFYNTDKLYTLLELKPQNTIQALDQKYIEWYKGREPV
jgi:2-alkyl-3-oxoalkanoate reductase